MEYNPVEIALFKQKNLSLLFKKMGNPGSAELLTTNYPLSAEEVRRDRHGPFRHLTSALYLTKGITMKDPRLFIMFV
jgi:hypothetical protein